jgi:NitT/TauT family transport system ATP-binding protein
LLTVDRLSIGYGRHGGRSVELVIDELSFSVATGEVVALVGPSGGGKTTLLKGIAGSLPITAGQVAWSVGSQERCWYMPQLPALVPFRTVLENVILSRELRGDIFEPDLNLAGSIVSRLGLESAASHLPSEISGGMRRRAVLGQALFSQDPLLLLDEPFAELDMSSRQSAEAVVEETTQSGKRTLVFATHDLDSATAIADRIILISGKTRGAPAQIEIASLFEEPLKRSQHARRSSVSFAAAVGRVQEFVIRAMEPRA